MDKINKKDQLKYYKFLNSLPKKINKLYFEKLAGKFKLHNKSKKSNGFDPDGPQSLWISHRDHTSNQRGKN